MTTLAQHVEDYLRLRRALGFKLEHYDGYSGRTSPSTSTRPARARSPPSWPCPGRGCRPGSSRSPPATGSAGCAASPATCTRSTRHTRSRRPACSPFRDGGRLPTCIQPRKCSGCWPAARRLRPPLRAATYETLFGLLAATGMRVGEALALSVDDVELDEGMLTIRHAKFDRTRLVPLHPIGHGSAAGLRRRARSTLPRPARRPVLRLRAPAAWSNDETRRGLRPDHRTAQDAHRHRPSAHPRPPAHVRGPDADRLAVRRDRRPRHAAGAVDLPRPRRAEEHLLVSVRDAGADATGRGSPRATFRQPIMTALAPMLQAFFTDRLAAQRHASPHTVLSYRDAFRLLLDYAAATTGKKPSALDIADLDAPLIASFLDHLERDRHNSVRTRNNRLAAIHSLFGYAALHHPEHADSHPAGARDPRQTLRPQDAHLAHRDRGRRPARRAGPQHLDRPARPRAARTRRPDRATNLRTDRASPTPTSSSAPAHTCAAWAKDARNARPRSPSTPSRSCAPGSTNSPARPPTRCSRPGPEAGSAATRSNTASPRYLANASADCRSLRGKRVTMHTLRHTAAMRLLQSGTDTAVIALWLGHEQLAHRPDLPPRRHGTEGTSDRQGHPARHPPRPLPTPGPATGLPATALIMPTSPGHIPRRTGPSARPSA